MIETIKLISSQCRSNSIDTPSNQQLLELIVQRKTNIKDNNQFAKMWTYPDQASHKPSHQSNQLHQSKMRTSSNYQIIIENDDYSSVTPIESSISTDKQSFPSTATATATATSTTTTNQSTNMSRQSEKSSHQSSSSSMSLINNHISVPNTINPASSSITAINQHEPETSQVVTSLTATETSDPELALVNRSTSYLKVDQLSPFTLLFEVRKYIKSNPEAKPADIIWPSNAAAENYQTLSVNGKHLSINDIARVYSNNIEKLNHMLRHTIMLRCYIDDLAECWQCDKMKDDVSNMTKTISKMIFALRDCYVI